MRFDTRTAKQMLPGSHLTFDDFPGLRLQASATRRSWIYRYKSPVDGVMRQVKLGEWPAMSYAAAISAWEQARAKRAAGEDMRHARREARKAGQGGGGDDGTYTVRQLCLDFLSGYIDKNRAPAGAAAVRRRVMAKIAPIANVAPIGVTRKQAFDLLAGLSSTPVYASSLRNELGAAWDYALDAGRIPETTPNWWRTVMKGKLQSKGKRVAGKQVVAKRVLSQDEIATLVKWLPNYRDEVRDVLTMYLWTALRGAELVAMEGQHVTAESDGLWWTIPKEMTKNRRRKAATDHRVPLVGRAEAIVRVRMKQYGKGYLFPHQGPDAEGPHITQRDVQQAAWERQPYSGRRPAEGQVPVTHWAPHDLRRTARTQLAALGCPREVGEAIVGHMLPGVEGIYNRHTYDAEKRVWLTRLADHLELLARSAAA
ncbi:tyrosine-type recombinase/integrase [Burkholderia sp. JKS000303]|uniref:tyrosine-type recombinase/integrase n=1 Tax=Burkholderia sp. JKS000303 TaxID=1938747 RepID=UPI000BF2BCF8|nr:integrase family protein [Burkholderia sp. JKS000303]PFH12917.1 uncharacterized protein DUF4102 [Burkholderia sp. JKS000303]